MSERVILHSDMNCFYASVEMLHHPEFAGMPLAVGGDPEARHGIVLTANYIAKKKGVKTGMALWQAKQVCPEIIFVPPRMDLYLRFSQMAREIYSEYTDKLFDERVEALVKLYRRAEFYLKQGFLESIVCEFHRKKVEMIMQAETKGEITEILKLSKPHFDGNKFV